MDKLKLVLILGLVVVASGCSPGENTDGPTESEGTGSVSVQGISVEPQEIYDGSSVRASVEFSNSGQLPADISLGDEGSNVMTNYCPDIFDIEDGSYQVVGPSDSGMDSYTLQPRQGLQVSWTLQERPSNQVPLYGMRCNLMFQVPFNYSVNSFRQIQVKRSRNVEGSQLQSKSTSGPLLFAIETIGGTGEEGKSTYIAGEDQNMRVLLQLQNRGQEGYDKGVVDIRERSLTIESDGPGDLDFTEKFTYRQDRDCEQVGGGGSGDLDGGTGASQLSPSASRGSVFDRVTGLATSTLKRVQGVAGGGSASGSYNYVVCSDEGVYVWEADDGQEPECEVDNNGALEIYEGQSRVIVCDLDVPESILNPSELVEISASVNYTYKKQIGSRTVQVKTRGG